MNHSISSLSHPLVKHLVKLRTDAAYRQEEKKVFLEGSKPIQEAFSLVQKLLYTPLYEEQARSFRGMKWQITEAILHKISGMSSPEGMVAEIQMPSFVELRDQKRVIALDGISDPGNLGTLLRTALAFGWDATFLLPGCCDPYNEKAIRAARGAHFKMSLAKGDSKQLKEWCLNNKIQPIVADTVGEHPNTFDVSTGCLLVLGNEAHGASAEIRHFCKSVSIPMMGEMESLNVAVAGGILLYSLSSKCRGFP